MAEVAALTLANICLDVQISICTFLHPSDILALRKTCKALQPSTRNRVVWMAALHRVCLDNALFLPSFPISDMSDLELEKAAMAPRRWIEFCGAFENQHLNDDSGAILHPRTTRIITDSFDTEVDYNNTDFVLVPGGRYLVSSSPDGISVLDLGYTSSADCKPIASVGPESEDCIVQPTPDGMGLTIFSSHRYEGCFVYEIYPQSETPHLIQIAHLDIDLSGTRATYLLTGRVIWCVVYEDRIVFTVWDYRLNHSIKFSVHVDSKQTASLKVMATQTAAIVLLKEAVLIWAFPPLSPQPPDFSDDNLTSIPPLFTIPFPDGIAISSARIGWKTISPWYFAFSHPLYFDISCKDSEIQRFQIMLKPDLSSASLRVINTSELTHDFNYVFFYDYMICEDSLVSCWTYDDQDQHRSGVYTRLPSARFAISHGGPTARMLLPDIGRKHLLYFCPASGRFVVLDDSNSLRFLFQRCSKIVSLMIVGQQLTSNENRGEGQVIGYCRTYNARFSQVFILAYKNSNCSISSMCCTTVLPTNQPTFDTQLSLIALISFETSNASAAAISSSPRSQLRTVSLPNMPPCLLTNSSTLSTHIFQSSESRPKINGES